MILYCALCPAAVAVQDAQHPQAPPLEAVECKAGIRLGWACSSDGRALCPAHAPRAPQRPLRDAIPTSLVAIGRR